MACCSIRVLNTWECWPISAEKYFLRMFPCGLSTNFLYVFIWKSPPKHSHCEINKEVKWASRNSTSMSLQRTCAFVLLNNEHCREVSLLTWQGSPAFYSCTTSRHLQMSLFSACTCWDAIFVKSQIQESAREGR